MEGTTGKAAAKRIFLQAINEAWPTAADLGYEDGGGDASELEPSELAEIDDATASQIDYAVNFWDALPDIREEGTDPFPRIELYVQSLRGWYGKWKVLGAGNKKLTFRLGSTQEHCQTCKRLDGQTHGAKWWVKNNLVPRIAGNDNFECGCWRCLCTLEDSEGNEFTLGGED